MALDGDEIDDEDDRDMLCIPPSLWVNADYWFFFFLHAGFLVILLVKELVSQLVS